MGCRNLSLCQEMAGHHLKGLEGCTVILYKLTIYFSGPHFLCKTLCTGSRLFIEGVAAPEWVFEESLVNEVRLLTKIIIETATVFHILPSIVLQWQSDAHTQLCMTQAPPSLS